MLLLLLFFGFVINNATRVYLGSTCRWIFDVVAHEVYGGVTTSITTITTTSACDNNIVICAFGGGMKAKIAVMGDGEQLIVR